MELYPLQLKSIRKDKIWGYELWQVCALGADLSEVQNGYLKENTLDELVEVYMGELVGDKVYEQYGNQFPLLIKIINTHDSLSVQVHPDDEAALQQDSLGKTEMWYVLKAEEEARLILGLKEDSSPQQVEENLTQGDIMSLLQTVKPQRGDVAYIPAGLIHALGKNLKVAEIQETSDITYRLYDYNRLGTDGKPRELHIQKALETINYKKHEQPLVEYQTTINSANNLITDSHFTCNIINIKDTILRDYTPLDSFVIYICAEGEADITANKTTVRLKEEQCVLIPASIDEVQLTPKKNSKILEVYIA